MPEFLSECQISDYRKDGYLILDSPFPVEDANAILSAAQENYDLSHADGIRVSNIDPRYTVLDTDERILRHLEESTILQVVEDLMGNSDFRLFHANFNNRTPGITSVINWHVDFSDAERPLGPRVEIAWYLTPTDRSNGCLRILPGSHLKSNKQIVAELEQHAKASVPWRSFEVNHPDEVDIQLGPDKILVRDGFLWHCTYRNLTQSIRYLHSSSYCTLSERAMLVDFELMLPRAIVESPTELQSRIFSLETYREELINRKSGPVKHVRNSLGLEKDRAVRESRFFVNDEDERDDDPSGTGFVN